jgi:TPR repeat protein
MFKLFLLSLLSFTLIACATTTTTPTMQSPRVTSEVAQGKRDFEAGYYKRSMHELLPLACDGSAEAQYAIGYMYYYGYGVGQDTEVGYFWIKRSSDQGYDPAGKALRYMDGENAKDFRARDRLKIN